MTRCTKLKDGTRKHGIRIHGTLLIKALPGSSKNTRLGPGAESAPRVTAVTRSARPKLFQKRTARRAVSGCLATKNAIGRAAAPAAISPQPATGANGAGSRLAA